MTSRAGRSAFLLLWLMVLGATLLAMGLLGARQWGIDDAYIFRVYAGNIADLNGFVYNAGGERVEGFSSLLWQLLLAVLTFLGLDRLLVFGLVASLLAAIALWAVCDLALHRMRTGIAITADSGWQVPSPLPVMLAWWFAWPAWFIWNVSSLMDVALWVCLLTLTLRETILLSGQSEITSGSLRRVSLLIFLLVLCRPEALLIGLLFIFFILVVLRWRGVPLLPIFMTPVLAFSTAVVGLTAFRQAYFGYPLPNTYYAKVSPDLIYRLGEGWAYLAGFLKGAGFAGPALLFAVVSVVLLLPEMIQALRGLVGFRTRERVELLQLAAFVTVISAVAVVEGGDHFGSWRMLQPIYPVLPLVVLYVWLGRERAKPMSLLGSGRAAVALALAFLVLAVPVRAGWHRLDRSGLLIEFHVAEEGLATAAALADALQPHTAGVLPVVGVTGAGGFAYAWSGDVFDLLGLNSVGMAHADADRTGFSGHAAFSKDFFFAMAPEIMVPHLSGWPDVMAGCEVLKSEDSFYGQVLNGLPVDPEFIERYAWIDLPVRDQALCMYVRRDYLQRLRTNGFAH